MFSYSIIQEGPYVFLGIPRIAFLILGFLYLLRGATKHPAMQGIVQAVTLSAAGLTLSTSVALAQDALRGWLTVGIAVISFVILVRFKLDVFWLMLGAAVIGLGAALMGLKTA